MARRPGHPPLFQLLSQEVAAAEAAGPQSNQGQSAAAALRLRRQPAANPVLVAEEVTVWLQATEKWMAGEG